ncbi:MAG: hypothetical protein RMM58_14560 [Chloroflexota bacterium]|nr:hypothetical protein [Dehalococcoidia bacterium]MDW8255095.1 hypothetical protein [Chloroflexota bacterium]
MRRSIRRRSYRPQARFLRVRPWWWTRTVLLALIELPLRLVAALWAGRAVGEWLAEEGVVYVDLLESRFLLLAVVGTAALAAIAAPLLTTRPVLWAIELLGRLGPYRLAGAALGAILGLLTGLLLVHPLPRLDEGVGAWVPFAITAGCGLAGALAFAGRPGVVRRLLVRRLSAERIAAPRVERLPAVSPLGNGHAPAELSAPARELTR